MGGYGSGRKWYHTKTTAEDCYKLDANDISSRKSLFKSGVMQGTIRWTRGGWERGACSFCAVFSGDRASVDFLYNDRCVKVILSWYSPGYGGRRYFFVCPRCGRRMRTLFINRAEIGCRICHDLTYTSCNQFHHFDSLYSQVAVGLKLPWHEVKSALSMMKKDANRKPKRPRGRPRKLPPKDGLLRFSEVLAP